MYTWIFKFMLFFSIIFIKSLTDPLPPPYQKCKDIEVTADVKNVSIDGCHPDGCIFEILSHASGIVDFIPSFGADQLKVMISADFFGKDVPLPGLNTNGCVNYGLACPIVAGQKYSLMITINVPFSLIPISTQAKFYLKDENDHYLVCLTFPIDVKFKAHKIINDSEGSDISGKIMPDIVTARFLTFLYLKGAEITVIPVNAKNKAKVIPSNVSCTKFPLCFDIDNQYYMNDFLDLETHFENHYPEPKLDCDENLQYTGFDLYRNFLTYVTKPSPDVIEHMKTNLKAIEELLAKTGGPFIAGEHPSKADCVHYPKLDQVRCYFDLCGISDILTPNEFPLLFAYCNKMKETINCEYLNFDREALVDYFRGKGSKSIPRAPKKGKSTLI